MMLLLNIYDQKQNNSFYLSQDEIIFIFYDYIPMYYWTYKLQK